MNSKVLTISIAAYNAEEYIEDCLESILSIKNVDRLEVLVIDDGGKDNTFSIAKKYENKYNGIVYAIHKENGGWGSTVNYSIKHANGKYFKILDADDQFDSKNLDKFITFLSEHNSDIVFSPYTIRNVVNKKSILYDSLQLNMHGLTFKTEKLIYDNFSLIEHCLYTDILYVFLSVNNSKSIDCFDKPIYIYNVGYNNQSISNKSFLKHVDEHERVCKAAIEIFNNLNSDDICIDYKIVYNRLLELVQKHFSILYMDCVSVKNKNRIICFDNYIKDTNRKLYEDINLKRIKILRLNNIFYYLIAPVLHIRSYLYRKLQA